METTALRNLSFVSKICSGNWPQENIVCHLTHRNIASQHRNIASQHRNIASQHRNIGLGKKRGTEWPHEAQRLVDR